MDQAERRSSCTSVAESGLVDTVALLAWVAGCLEDEDSHNLATTVSRAASYAIHRGLIFLQKKITFIFKPFKSALV